MTQIRNTVLILLLIFILSSCKDSRGRRKVIVSEKIEYLLENQAEWNNLTQRILKESYVNENLGEFINPIDLSKPIAKELDERGIYRITVYNDPKCKKVEYTTDWTKYPIGTLYLIWSTCDSEKTSEGYYQDNFNQNFIEVWGVGNNWRIMTDSDFI